MKIKLFLKTSPWFSLAFRRNSKLLTCLARSRASAYMISGLGASNVLKCFLNHTTLTFSLVPPKCHFLFPPCFAAYGFLCLEGLHIFLQLLSFVLVIYKLSAQASPYLRIIFLYPMATPHMLVKFCSLYFPKSPMPA